jgi:hypothetical protein
MKRGKRSLLRFLLSFGLLRDLTQRESSQHNNYLFTLLLFYIGDMFRSAPRTILRPLVPVPNKRDPTLVTDDYLKRTKWIRSSIRRQDLLNTYKRIKAKILLKI